MSQMHPDSSKITAKVSSKVADFKVIAMDGPGGVGKSTTARALAERLGFFFLSTGLIYRAMAWQLLRSGWIPGQSPSPAVLETLSISVDKEGGVCVNGHAAGEALGSDEISGAASQISSLPEVRELSNRIQRETVAGIANDGAFSGVILEGRDIGTVVFPDADYKFFITADPAIRAKRRHAELIRNQPDITLEEVTEALRERDQRDETRELAPLKPAVDAREIDTSSQTLAEVVESLYRMILP